MTPEEFFSVLNDLPPVIESVYRLYHDDQGTVLFYTMEDLPGSWIAVDALTYAQAKHDVHVIDGKVTPLPKKALVNKLRPNNKGATCDPRDICIIVSSDQPHVKWSID